MENINHNVVVSCIGKQAFTTAAAAMRANKGIAKRRPGLVAYRCINCHQYHLGNKPTQKLTNKEKARARRKIDRYFESEATSR